MNYRMKAETTKEVSTELYSMLGYDQASKRVRMGMLAEKTHPYIMEKVVEMLMSEFKFSKEEATQVMDKTWKDTPENMQIKSTGNLGLLFKTLKKQGLSLKCENTSFKLYIFLSSRYQDCHLHLRLSGGHRRVPYQARPRVYGGPRALRRRQGLHI